MDSFYVHDHVALMNFTKAYAASATDLLDSDEFKYFLALFIEHLKKTNYDLYTFLTTLAYRRRVESLIRLLKMLTVLRPEEIETFSERERDLLLQIVEAAYLFWRNMQRISMVETNYDGGLLPSSFIDADNAFNTMILTFYRSLQEKLQGSSNLVYRQLHAGTNAAMLLSHNHRAYPERYQQLNTIAYIHKVLLHTPLIIHPHSNKRKGMFTLTATNPMDGLTIDPNEFLTMGIWVGESLCLMSFHRDYTPVALGCVNLFELATLKDVENHKPDLIMLFGIDDDQEETTYYHDQTSNIWVGKISRSPWIDYFGYFKKMALTLHNLKNIHAGKLPIHGAMIKITFKDGSTKGVVLMGDSGAGKSESIAAMTKIAGDQIDHQEVIFDDMGAMWIDEHGTVVANGTEIGAFVRLDDLDSGTAYKDMDRSIFFNPETSNARVVLPMTPYGEVIKPHPVDIFLYANNYDPASGVELFEDAASAKAVFVQGRRFALGTTNEIGISDTYFANPFGPMQEKQRTEPLIDTIFQHIATHKDVALGQIFTHLGRADKSDAMLESAAQALLDLAAPRSDVATPSESSED